MNNMSFDLIIANPPYGYKSNLAKDIINSIASSVKFKQFVCLATQIAFRKTSKYVTPGSLVPIKEQIFEDAAIQGLCLARIQKEPVQKTKIDILRETLDPYEKYSFIMLCYRLANQLMFGTNGKSIKNILKENNYKLPKLRNIRQDVDDYLATKPANRFTMAFKRLKKPYRITSVYRLVTESQKEITKLIMKEFNR